MIQKNIIALLISTIITTSVFATEISSYLYAAYKDTPSVVNTLKSNGFDVVGEYDAMGDANYHVVVFTNDLLKKDASKENRGFAGVLKVLVSNVDNQLVFTNPDYFLSAFMQDDFNKNTANSIVTTLTKSFGPLKGSKEVLDDDDISGYHYMFGMPYYEDMVEIAEGENLLEIIKNNAQDKLIFELNLNGATLIGIAMPGESGEKGYITKIKGQKHAAFEPYMILIEGNKAKIMHAKYYLALAYPNLSMGEFMDISSAPDDIENFMSAIATKRGKD